MYYIVGFVLFVLFSSMMSGCKSDKAKTNHQIDGETKNSLQQYFEYKPGNAILVSGHRGGREYLYPENSIEGLQRTAGQMQVFFEIDPRLTKDSVIVLMHDPTLDRTTNGKGKLSDYTWNDLQSVRLKDFEGNLTKCKIPKLEDVIIWSKEKSVVINLDKKDAPMEGIVDIIKKCDAQDYIMLTVHTGAQARFYYDRFPDIMFSVFIRNKKEYEDMSISGVPWKNMIAYVGHTIDEKNRDIVEKLHIKGVKCMISTAPTHDNLEQTEERAVAYAQERDKKPDIIESDYPAEVWDVLNRR